MSATAYAEITKAVQRLIEETPNGNDPTVNAYMICRASLLWVNGLRGGDKASQMAYRLGDELATGDPK